MEDAVECFAAAFEAAVAPAQVAEGGPLLPANPTMADLLAAWGPKSPICQAWPELLILAQEAEQASTSPSSPLGR